VTKDSPGHELQNVCPILPYWQSVKYIQIGYKFSQILTNEPQISTVNPYATSIYGCIRKKRWRPTPPGWLAETSQPASRGVPADKIESSILTDLIYRENVEEE
jgi:hypothetical protein